MQIRFILGECPNGWLNAGELCGCYLFSPDGPILNWEEARAFFESVGCFLTDIHCVAYLCQGVILNIGLFQNVKYPLPSIKPRENEVEEL